MKRKRDWLLASVLVILIVVMLCGAEGWVI